MTYSRAVLLVVLALAMTSAREVVADQPVHLDGLILPSPEGHCRLDEAIAAERRVIDRMEESYVGDVEVLALLQDCEELAAWRRGERDRFSHWFVVWRIPEFAPRFAAVEPASDCLVPAGMDEEAAVAAARESISAVLAEAGARPGETVTEELGALTYDAEACYTAAVAATRLEGGGDGRTILLARAMVVIGEALVGGELGEATDDPDALARLLDRVRAWRRTWRRAS